MQNVAATMIAPAQILEYISAPPLHR